MRLVENNQSLTSEIFREIFVFYYDSLCRFSELLVKDSVIAEECVQTVFMHIWEKRDHIKFEKKVKSYLFRSVYNQSINMIKRREVERKSIEILKLIPPDQNQDIIAEIAAHDLEKLLHKKLNEMPPKVREVFELSRFEGLKYKEISQKLNVPIKTIEGRMTKALVFLRLSLNFSEKIY